MMAFILSGLIAAQFGSAALERQFHLCRISLIIVSKSWPLVSRMTRASWYSARPRWKRCVWGERFSGEERVCHLGEDLFRFISRSVVVPLGKRGSSKLLRSNLRTSIGCKLTEAMRLSISSKLLTSLKKCPFSFTQVNTRDWYCWYWNRFQSNGRDEIERLTVETLLKSAIPHLFSIDLMSEEQRV